MAIDVAEMDRMITRGENPRARILFHVIVTADEQDAAVADAVAAACDPFYDIYGVGSVLLPRQTIEVHSAKNSRDWFAEVTYQLSGGRVAATQVGGDEDDIEYTFGTSNGTRRIKRAKELRKFAPNYGVSHPQNAPNTLLIGITDDSVEGIDLPDRAFVWSEVHIKDASAITDAYILTLESMIDTVNDAVFRERATGEVRLMDYKAHRNKGESNVAITFDFERRPNRIEIDGETEFGDATLSIPGTTGDPAAYGHDYVWIQTKKKKDSTTNTLIDVPRFVFVDRMFDFSDFSDLEIGT